MVRDQALIRELEEQRSFLTAYLGSRAATFAAQLAERDARIAALEAELAGLRPKDEKSVT